MLKPKIYSFKDPVEYLEASYNYLKAGVPELTVRKWAALMGIADAELLFTILKRKKQITLSLIAPLDDFFDHDLHEKKYFELMVLHSRAASQKEREIFGQLMMEESLISGEAMAFVKEENIFSHWLHMAVLAATKIKDFKATSETIAHMLLEDIPVSEVQNSINLLLARNLLQIDEQGVLKEAFEHTQTAAKNDVSIKSVHNYYEQVFELSKKAIPLSTEEREFQCFTITLKQEEIHLFKDAIRQFRVKTVAMAREDGDQVFQFNMQLFPLTNSVTPQIEAAP